MEQRKKRKAVALKYPDGVEAPIILAKGEGHSADLMLAEAEKNGIPVAEDKVLVDMLGLSSAGQIVPENAWQALAVIFSYIIEERNEHKENR
jgi:flagellar biosynthesis protein